MIAIFVWLKKKQKKIFFSGFKQRNENPGHIFIAFILFNNITVEKN